MVFKDDDDGAGESIIEIINPSPKSTIENYDDEDDDHQLPYSPINSNSRFWDPLMYRSSPPPYYPYLFLDYINNYKRKSSINRNRFNPNSYFRNHPSMEENDEPQQQQIQSRGRYRPAAHRPAYSPLLPESRFFFGLLNNNNDVVFSANSTANRFFGRTRGVISTSTVNLTTVISCVSSTEFVAGRNAPACRRRRRGMEHLLAFDDLVGSPSVSPSEVEKYCKRS